MDRNWLQQYPAHIRPEIDQSKITSIAEVLHAASERYADKPACTCMGVTVTYRQLDRMVGKFASYLQHEVGLKKGDRFAIMLPNIIQFPIAFIAAQRIGVICVNTNPLYTPREMKHQFVDSGAIAIIIVDLFMDKLEKILPETQIKTVISTSVADLLPIWKSVLAKRVMKFKKLVPRHNLTATEFRSAMAKGSHKPVTLVKMGPEDLAVLQYTGGTTGLSKGAMLTQRNILANIFQIQHWISGELKPGEEVVMTAIPLYHIFALTLNFLAFQSIGCHSILIPKPVPIENTVAIFKKFPITVMTGVNTLFNALANNKEFKKLAPRTIKLALGGGMAVQDVVSRAWQQITGLKITQAFGLTEASPGTHANVLSKAGPLNSIGLPIPSTEAKIVDEQGNEVPHGEPGELIIRGPQVMKGYWQKPEETAKTIRDGWLWTGDMARRDEQGFFYIVDRKKDMILVSGFNVYPNEVEDVICSHPKVLEAAVIGIADSNSGESVKAFIVKKDESLTVEELRHHCSEQLTGYKRPRHIEFRKDLPKSNVGKILRRELRDEKKSE